MANISNERRKVPRHKVSWQAAVISTTELGHHTLHGQCIEITGSGIAVCFHNAVEFAGEVVIFLSPPQMSLKDDRVFKFSASFVYVLTMTDGGTRVGFRFRENQSLIRLKEIFGEIGETVAEPIIKTPALPSAGPSRPQTINTGTPSVASKPSKDKKMNADQNPVTTTLLDQIRAQAAQKQLDQEAAAALRQRIFDEWCIKADEALRAAYKYFSDLFASLNILQPKLPMGFPIPPVTLLENLTWVAGGRADFRLRKVASEIDRYESIILMYRWRGAVDRVNVTIMRDDRKICERTLDACGIAYHSEKVASPIGREQVNLRFINEIVCTVVLLPDDDASHLRLRLKNVAQAGTREFSLPLEALNKATYDEITRMILGEKHNFDALPGITNASKEQAASSN